MSTVLSHVAAEWYCKASWEISIENANAHTYQSRVLFAKNGISIVIRLKLLTNSENDSFPFQLNEISAPIKRFSVTPMNDAASHGT